MEETLPFASYPDQGRKLKGRLSGGNCRHEYGLKFMKVTGQTKCAYCGLDIAGVYENWLNMALDHVVPVSVCQELRIPGEWCNDLSNLVLSCAACNGFGNRYRKDNALSPKTVEEFYVLRDTIFVERKNSFLRSTTRNALSSTNRCGPADKLHPNLSTDDSHAL
jgi:5-methylcytosine-specific restriction endonuclease McrA